jgi:hypothetical protein
MGNFLILFILLVFSDLLDVHADGATDVMCNVIGYVHGIGGLMFNSGSNWFKLTCNIW